MIFAWISLFAFLSSAAMGADATPCDGAYAAVGISKTEAYRRLMDIEPELALTVELAQALPTELISGNKVPGWADLEELDYILKTLKKGKFLAAENGKTAELNALVPDLAEAAKSDYAFQKISAAGGQKVAKPDSYQPTEYELKRLYQAKLWRINRELPAPLKIRGSRIPLDQRRNALVDEARALIKAQEKNYQSVYPATGFPNREALIAAIKKQSPEAEAVLAMLEKEEVEFVMRRPERGRWWIPKVGFQNQRVTGSSRGAFDTNWRDTSEAYLTFGKKFQYEMVDNDLKPKYGYLRPKPGQILVAERGSAARYGEDIYILKKDRLRDRTTWTAGDSLGRGMYKKETDVPQVWHDAFTPWNNRELLAPVLLPPDLAEENKFRIRKPYFDEKSPLGPFRKSVPNTLYPEMQYWGPVTLDDVEAFEFSGNSPSGEFLDELLKRKIKIRDASGGSPVDWAPPKEAGK